MSKGEIVFHVESWDGQKISLKVETQSGVESLFFRASKPFFLDGDNLAIALSTLCGPAYSAVEFDFEVSQEVCARVASWTRSSVSSTSSGENLTRCKSTTDSTVLNFSGGLDSLASRYLLGPKQELVSIDFGGRFGRERKFFKEFNPWIVETNLIETTLRQNSWSFMGIGPLLLLHELKSRYFAFGSILEAHGLRPKQPARENFTFPPFADAGYENIAPVAGVSEAGTVMILIAHEPDLLAPSLQSLASPGEEKYYRKLALVNAVNMILDARCVVPKVPGNPKIHYCFGESLTVDLTAMFFKAFGFERYAKAIVSEIPTSIENQIRSSDFEFMLKADGAFYSAYPEAERKYLEGGLSTANIAWYGEQEYHSLAKIRSLLSPYYAHLRG